MDISPGSAESEQNCDIQAGLSGFAVDIFGGPASSGSTMINHDHQIMGPCDASSSHGSGPHPKLQ